MMQTIERDTQSLPKSAVPTVLVLGAAGRFGSEACLAFAKAGWQVYAQARKDLPRSLVQAVHFIEADALDVEGIVRQLPSPQSVKIIVHALNPDYARWDSLLPPITEAVIQLAQRCGARVLIPGNVYNFGSELPEMLTESTPFVSNTEKARQRIAMEQRFAEASGQGMTASIIRAGDFIGGRGTWLDMAIAKSLKKSEFTVMGPQHLPHAWAYLPDLARAFVKVAEHDHQLAAYEVFHYPGITASMNELQAAFQQLLGLPLQVKTMPWTLLHVVALFSPLMRAVLPMRYLWQRPHRLSGEKLMRLIGPLPQVSLQQALREYLPQEPSKVNTIQQKKTRDQRARRQNWSELSS
ncbi:NAD-dependent epimerase/dehydratase family protein [Undibacterium cyanobacteriorum]|uniref:NAD-dependent epimerase/dehydratase family protein n=1 Tax=Undibacterium cyanobacteriorum TaxID=3073561 RepID=A0ABY9RJM3_9BURK|nr:NAD-dependent epimerase/dehydratase family protein [Undibacterium sp. 20NA77.5]WMW80850.1 NAD-dependent epimerase/dehydratase family protein [Undibacterium sp. 20NA77.5]